jgi:hypothetical protein
MTATGLGSGLVGLSSAEATRRLEADGPDTVAWPCPRPVQGADLLVAAKRLGGRWVPSGDVDSILW